MSNIINFSHSRRVQKLLLKVFAIFVGVNIIIKRCINKKVVLVILVVVEVLVVLLVVVDVLVVLDVVVEVIVVLLVVVEAIFSLHC